MLSETFTVFTAWNALAGAMSVPLNRKINSKKRITSSSSARSKEQEKDSKDGTMIRITVKKKNT